MVKFLVKLFSKSLQGIKGGGAPFCSAQCATRSRKRPCQPKTAKRFFGGPGSQGPSGQAKERTRILPVRRGFSAPGVPCRLPGRSFFRSLSLSGLLAFAPGVSARVPCCSPGGCACALPQVGLRSASLFPARVPCCLLLLRLACAASCCFCLCPVLPGPACWKCARVLPCAAFFSYLSPFPASLLSLKILFTCRSGRDGPLLSSEKKVDKDSQRGFAPLNPIPVPCGCSFLLPRCWPA